MQEPLPTSLNPQGENELEPDQNIPANNALHQQVNQALGNEELQEDEHMTALEKQVQSALGHEKVQVASPAESLEAPQAEQQIQEHAQAPAPKTTEAEVPPFLNEEESAPA